MCRRIAGSPFPVADAFLDDPADVSRIDGEELARRRHRGELGLDVVRDPIERPPERVGNHRNRFGEADVPHAAVGDLPLELLGRHARANLLLERQPARPRILNAIDDDAIDTGTDGGERDRQRIHHEPRIHAGAEDRDLRLFRPRMDLAARAGCACSRDRRALRSSRRSAFSISGSFRAAAGSS